MANPAHLTTHFQCEWPADRVPEEFGIVTAWNPEDQPATPSENSAADVLLERFLRRQGWRYFRVTGESPDGRHAEPGWGIEASLAELLAVGRQFRQAAIYWIQGTQLWLCSCSDEERLALGPWRDRTRFPG